MRIIGAGLPRTATLAQKIALEMLGAGPCYHMVTVLADLDRVGGWQRAIAGDACWDDIFAGFTSTVDWPGGHFYRDLIDVYPDAKVILSVRDPQSWAASMRATVLAANRGGSVMGLLSQARSLVDPGWRAFNEMTSAMIYGDRGLLGCGGDESALADLFQRHIDEVRATVPPDRLLVWAAAEGWAPLCDFVGAPVPGVAFPHVNDSNTFEDRLVAGALDALNDYLARRSTGQGPDGPASPATRAPAIARGS